MAVEEVLTEEQAFIKALNEREHYHTEECWCFPTLLYTDAETGKQVWQHHLPN